MGGVIFFVVVVVLFGAAIWFAIYLKKKRRQALAAFAARFGLQYSAEDPFGLLEYGFRLFRLGEGRGCENVLWGDWHDMPIKEADYWYYTESTDSKGHRSKSYKHFSVVIIDVEATLPPVSIQKENVFTRMADHLGFRDLEFESEEFNRRFQVKGTDRQFAYKLVDARMIRWLLGTEGDVGFESSGSALLAFSRRRKPTELVELLGMAGTFRRHVPRLVWSEYGTNASPTQPDDERSSS